MINFDSATREVCTVRENRTNTPLQALNLMNDETYLEASRKLAERVMHDPAPLERAFVLTLGRRPSAREKQILEASLAKFQQRFNSDPEAAKKLLAIGESKSQTGKPAELAALMSVTSMILNLDEAITKQ
jgi:hypothetical protein